MKKRFYCLILFLIGTLIFADEKGYEIAKKNKELKKAIDSYSEAEMILIDKNGNQKKRKIVNYTKEGKEGKNSFVEFLEPADVKGTKFLTIARKGDDEQRLWLPALKKTRLIASSSKDAKFMGSDLYYYDMEDRDLDDFDYKYIKDDKTQNIDCFVIEATPKSKNAPYSRSFMWVSKNNYFIYKIEAYDKKDDKLLKTIVFVEVKEIQGVLVPTKTVVDNAKEGTKTLLSITNIKINSGIKDDIFTVQNLER
ncbi:MAG TPA: outer membrane lipoprotein-sorting protein [Spirochaetota bacterium]|nr:outer membrane lipoprotein-sorting protein [Spirochaetota bacterium]HOL58137.1 outer membrane lipoprotein-sorting protein [Spirochaetota bacterium]HPP05598.1 outer membrane lipoprotein-sorting protein [Spirochaetota bacterium]